MTRLVAGWGAMSLVAACVAWIGWQACHAIRERRAKRAIEEAARIAAHFERRRQACAWARKVPLTIPERAEWTGVLAASYTDAELAGLEARAARAFRAYGRQP